MTRFQALLLCVALALPGSAALAQSRAGAPATCARDLFQNEAALQRELTRLQNAAAAPQAEQCRVWREHTVFLQRARAVFATCQAGRQREENVGQMDASLTEYRVLLRDRCGR